MLLGLARYEGDSLSGTDREDADDDGTAHLTEDDLDRIRSVALTPRFRRTPEMLCPDPSTEDDDA